MQETVDARGCGKASVIKTKIALEKVDIKNVLTIVDNEKAKNEIFDLVKSLNLKCNIIENHGEFYIDIVKTEAGMSLKMNEKKDMYDSVVLCASDSFGDGNKELGDILMRGYFYTLTELKIVPNTIIFLNSGIKLTTKGSPILKELRNLESKGVEIITSETCLDFYNLKSDLEVGGVSTMYKISEALNNTKKVIRL